MPREAKVRWDAGTNRWRLNYKGKKYRWPGVKGKSDREAYNFAVQSWKRQKLLIDANEFAKGFRLSGDYDGCIDGWEAALEAALATDDQDAAETANVELERLSAELNQEEPLPLTPEDWHPAALPLEYHQSVGFLAYLNNDPVLSEAAFKIESSRLESARARLAEGRRTRKSRIDRVTLGGNLDQYLAEKRKCVESNDITPRYMSTVKYRLEIVMEFLPRSTKVSTIDGSTLVNLRQWLLMRVADGHMAASGAKDCFGAFKTLARWMYHRESLESLPRNIDSKGLNFHVEAKQAEVLSVEDFGKLWEAATSRTRLYLGLGLLLGFRQSDIADIRPEEVDCAARTLTRSRTKTRKKGGQEVVYTLPPTLMQLLLAEGDPNGGRLLLTKAGGLLMTEVLRDDGKVKRTDAIKLAINRACKKSGVNCTPATLRSTGATMLESHPEHESVGSLRLGHSAKNVKDRHYANPPVERLGNAIAWLAREFGIES